jgi:hypothetical protein
MTAKLEPVARTPGPRSKPFGIAAFALGVLSFAVVAIVSRSIWDTPDPRLSLPGVGLVLAASVASVVRKERAWWLWPVGLGIAAATVVLGWFVMIGVVVAATIIVMLIVHAVM